MKRFRILVDLDGICADLLDSWLKLYNADWLDSQSKDGIHSYDTHLCVRPECGKKVYDYLATPGLYRGLKPIDGAIPFVKQLAKDGHEVCIATAPSKQPETASDKMFWIGQNMPFIDRKNVFLCHRKEWIKADAIIDDSPIVISEYKAHWPDAIVAAISYPYNTHMAGRITIHAEGHNDTFKAWNTIYSGIKDRSLA